METSPSSVACLTDCLYLITVQTTDQMLGRLFIFVSSELSAWQGRKLGFNPLVGPALPVGELVEERRTSDFFPDTETPSRFQTSLL
jgi:hypothetical protein